MFKFDGTVTEDLQASAGSNAGSNVVVIEDTGGGSVTGSIPTGTRISFANHEGTYIVNNYNSTDSNITVSPNLRASVASGEDITYDGTKLHLSLIHISEPTRPY